MSRPLSARPGSGLSIASASALFMFVGSPRGWPPLCQALSQARGLEDPTGGMDRANGGLHRGVTQEGGVRPPWEHFPKGVKPAVGFEPELEGVAQVGKAGRGRRPRGAVHGARQGQPQRGEQGHRGPQELPLCLPGDASSGDEGGRPVIGFAFQKGPPDVPAESGLGSQPERMSQ